MSQNSMRIHLSLFVVLGLAATIGSSSNRNAREPLSPVPANPSIRDFYIQDSCSQNSWTDFADVPGTPPNPAGRNEGQVHVDFVLNDEAAP